MIKVSVLMPSLNVKDYIDECLGSVVRQSLKDIEIICIDAGSTDGTLEVIQSYADKDSRIRIINSDRKSYGYQMNLGLKAAVGKYIGIVETDDFCDASMFEDFYRAAEENSSDAVKSSFYRYNGGRNTKYSEYEGMKYNCNVSAKDYPGLYLNDPAIWSGLYNRQFLIDNDIWFLETAGASFQDTGFIRKVCACTDKILLLDKARYHYRLDNAASSVHSANKVYLICEEFEELDKFYREKNIDISLHKMLWVSRAESYLWNAGRIGKEYRAEFADHIKKEIDKAKKEGTFDEAFFSKKTLSKLDQLFKDPEGYNGYNDAGVKDVYYSIERHGLKYVLKNAWNIALSYIGK